MQASYARNEIMVVRVELEDMRKEVGRLHEEIATDLGVEVHWSNGHTLDQFVVILEEALSHMPEGTFNAAFERVLLLRQGQQMAEAKRSDEEKGK